MEECEGPRAAQALLIEMLITDIGEQGEKDMGKEGRGTSSVVSTADNITVTRWLDSSSIHIASTCAGKYPEDS